MERLDSIELLKDVQKNFLYTCVDYQTFKAIEREYKGDVSLKFFSSIDDARQILFEYPYQIIVNATSLEPYLTRVEYVEDREPRSIYEKNTNDYPEWIATLKYFQVKPDFYIVERV